MVKISVGSVFYGNTLGIEANDNVAVRTPPGREVRGNHNFIVFHANDNGAFLIPVYTNPGHGRIALDRQFAHNGWMQHKSFVHPNQIWAIPCSLLPYKFAEAGTYAQGAVSEVSRLVREINRFNKTCWRSW